MLAMIGEKRALIQTRRYRQRKWNGHGLLFLQLFLLYFTLHISQLFLVLHFTILMQKIKKLVAGATNGRKKEKRQRNLRANIGCYFYNYVCFISLYTLVSS